MLEECVVLADGARLETKISPGMRYSLRYGRTHDWLVSYWNDGKGHRRRVRGRESAYEFRSVEQLRYDFERDVENAQRQD